MKIFVDISSMKVKIIDVNNITIEMDTPPPLGVGIE
jgi:hypothetical protein